MWNTGFDGSGRRQWKGMHVCLCLLVCLTVDERASVKYAAGGWVGWMGWLVGWCHDVILRFHAVETDKTFKTPSARFRSIFKGTKYELLLAR